MIICVNSSLNYPILSYLLWGEGRCTMYSIGFPIRNYNFSSLFRDVFLSQFPLTNGEATSGQRTEKNTVNSKGNWFHLSYWFPDPLFLARPLHTNRSSAFRLLFSSLYGVVVFNVVIKPSYLILSSLSRSLALELCAHRSTTSIKTFKPLLNSLISNQQIAAC